jgi:hypothetical protein
MKSGMETKEDEATPGELVAQYGQIANCLRLGAALCGVVGEWDRGGMEKT